MSSNSVKFAVILPAAGRSVRFGRNKLLEPLNGSPVIARSVAAFLRRHDVAQLMIATSDPQPLEDALKHSSPGGQVDARVKFCEGGDSRAASVWRAARAVSEQVEWIAVHDAARPLVSQELIDRTLAAAVNHGAAVPAMPVALTIKQAAGPLPTAVERTVPRHTLWAVQTPQIMRRTDLLAAFETCPISLDQVTDDVQLLELAGRPTWLVAGEERNLKITTALDIRVAEAILAEE